MGKKVIESAAAKEELQRIDEVLTDPVLIIGGMAVQQYCIARDSKDLDLVCSHEVVRKLLEQLYPMGEWEHTDANRDEYRPSIRIKHLSQDRGEIILGPKITERENYPFIEWERLHVNTRPFKFRDKEFLKILVPSPAALAFTKLISFIDRREKTGNKSKRDLQDFVDLSNHPEFSLVRFISVIATCNATQYIKASLSSITASERALFGKSSISRIQELLGISNGTATIADPTPTIMKPISSEIARIALKYHGKNVPKATGRELLLVVDVQNDFCAGGALAAQDTKSLIEPLNLLIRNTDEAGVQVVFARDWHPHNHYSFEDWGAHCVHDTPGAAFHKDLHLPSEALIVDIGTSNEMDGYSPFHDPALQSLASSSIISTIYIVGLALEFCILAACRDAVWFGKTVIAVEPFIRSATPDVSEREAVWNLIESFGVVRGRNVPLRRPR